MKNIYFLFIFLWPISIYAQDTIFKKDSSIHIGKVIKITDNQIKYVKSNNQNDAIFVISIEDIYKISYEKGKVDYYNTMPTYNTTIAVDPITKNFGRNFFSINSFDLINGLITITYERTFKSGDFSVKIPLSSGMIALGLLESSSSNNDDSREYYNRNKMISTGIDLNAYPFGQGKTKYFMGTSFEYGIYNRWEYDYTNSLTYTAKKQHHYVAFLFQNGFLFQPTRNFNYSINIGVGCESYKDYHDFIDRLVVRAGLNLGFKF
ncbi:MAG: hypothetical protein ACOYOV_08810 [Bacteroidales bacterium]